jgi:MFS family permease
MVALTAPDAGLDLAPARRRAVRVLFAGVGLGSTGYIAAVTVATIVTEDLAGGSAWAGVPGAAAVLGSAAGASILSAIMIRRTRRAGLAAGYLVGTVGAVLAIIAITARSFPLFLAATALLGFASSSNQLSRYAAADMYPVSRRASAIGTVVWGATIGAVIGPSLGTLAGRWLGGTGHSELVGVYLVPVVFVTAAAILSFGWLRPDPYELADERMDEAAPSIAAPVAPDLRALIRRPTVAMAMVALVAGQVVMVLIMTMTPLHMTDHGHDLGAVGLVISGHVFGMYALSPVTGRLTDRFGSIPVVFGGMAVLAISAALAALAPADGGALLFLALFLLGYGWNLGYVAGSTLLASGLVAAERTRVEGATDTLVWGSAAVASLGSGLIVAAAGFTALCLLAMTFVVVPVWILATRRPSPTNAIRA